MCGVFFVLVDTSESSTRKGIARASQYEFQTRKCLQGPYEAWSQPTNTDTDFYDVYWLLLMVSYQVIPKFLDPSCHTPRGTSAGSNKGFGPASRPCNERRSKIVTSRHILTLSKGLTGCIFLYKCKCVYINICLYIYICKCVYIYMYIYIYTCIYTQIYTHSFMMLSLCQSTVRPQSFLIMLSDIWIHNDTFLAP
jgi:hypothetical protein